MLFTAAAFLAGGRMLVGNAFGLRVAPGCRLAIMGTRAAAHQFGYFVGAALGGIALSAGGYSALGLTLGGLFVGAALAVSTTHTRPRVDQRVADVRHVIRRTFASALRELLFPPCRTHPRTAIRKGVHS